MNERLRPPEGDEGHYEPEGEPDDQCPDEAFVWAKFFVNLLTLVLASFAAGIWLGTAGAVAVKTYRFWAGE